MVTLGTDPEVFVVQRSSGRVIPSYDVMGAHSAVETGLTLPFGHLSGDGAALEWTQHPASTPQQAAMFTSANYEAVGRLVRGADPDWMVSLAPSVTIEQEDRDRLDNTFGNVFSLQMFGCSPDVCVYFDLELPERPNPTETLLRTAGGHIHLGVGDLVGDFDAVSVTAIILDRILATMAVAAGGNTPGFKERMRLYGSPGMIRVNQERGLIEYRVLPSMSLLVHPYSVFSLANRVGEVCKSLWEYSPETLYEGFNTYFASAVPDVVDTILHCDTARAHEFHISGALNLNEMEQLCQR